jgi:hypothetical protein
MSAGGVYLEEAFTGNPMKGLCRKRMLNRLQLEQRTLSAWLWMDLALQIQRVGIALQSVGKPTKPGSQALLVSTVECGHVLVEILSCQCGPHAEAEILSRRPEER